MKTHPITAPLRPLIGPAVITAICATLLAAFAGWSMYGTSILFTYAQDGLAWCF